MGSNRIGDQDERMSRIRVAFVVPTLDQSGAEKQLYLLAKNLPRDRFEPHVVAITRGGHFEGPLRDAGVAVEVIGKRMKFDPTALWRLKTFLAELKPDLVHTWLFAGNSYGRAAALWAKCPHLIASERCVDTWKRQHQFAVDRWLGKRTDAIAVNSQAVAGFYAKVGIDPAKLAVVPNAIETGGAVANAADIEVARVDLEVPNGVPLLGFVGRLWPQKRVQDLIWAADILRIGGFDFRVAIVGEGPRRSALEGLTRSLDLGRIVRFTGHRADAGKLIAAMDALVLPSRFEGMPNVALEAMLAGKPVVATRIPGMDEVVVDGVTGSLIAVKRPMELARALSKLVVDPELRTRMGEAGRQRVVREFSVEQMVERYAALYGDVLSGDARRSAEGRNA